jgi:hypothetical protein
MSSLALMCLANAAEGFSLKIWTAVNIAKLSDLLLGLESYGRA